MDIELKLQSIEEDYISLRNRYYSIANISGYRNDKIINETIKLTLNFHSNIEILYEDVKDIIDDKVRKYFNRIEESLNIINTNLRGRMGNVHYFKGAIELLNSDSYYECDLAYKRINTIKDNVYRFCEDIRLLYTLKTYPIEEKLKIKSVLSDHGFIEVVQSLDELDDNLLKGHSKDALARGRDALEKLIFAILLKIEKKPSYHFGTDIGTLGGLGFIDRENKKLIEATFSLLSEVGSHGRTTKEDVNRYTKYAIKELFMKIDKLINLYEYYEKSTNKK